MNGKIYIVGTGPGSLDYLSTRAIDALKNSEVIVGYKTYINLIAPLCEGKTIHSSGMRKEVERCQQVIDIALTGKTVSMISSGDSGVYGMAGIILEMAAKTNPDLEVEVVPGITSALSSASLAGAALMNDFAVISLSDLMTPWSVIEKRIDKAADGDFVMSIYNPKSKERVEQIAICQAIVSKYRGGNTPVAIIKNAMRQESNVTLTTLDKMLDCHIDMTTTVIIGNSQTFVLNNKMITPRGYTL